MSIKSIMGKSMIGTAMSTFDDVIRGLEDGKVHLEADSADKREVSRKALLKVDENAEEIKRADRVLEKVKQLVA